MINFSLDLPPAKKKTRNQIARDWMIDNAKRSISKGYYDKFEKRILEARKKDEAINKAKKKVGALDWIDFNIATNEPYIATPKQKEKLENLEILKKNINRVATKPTEENLYDTYIQMLREGTLKPMSFEEFEKNFPILDINITKKPRPKPTEWMIEEHPELDEGNIGIIEDDRKRTASMWSNIKNSSIYKLLENEKLLGTELGHGALIELIHLAQNYGLMKRGGRVK